MMIKEDGERGLLSSASTDQELNIFDSRCSTPSIQMTRETALTTTEPARVRSAPIAGNDKLCKSATERASSTCLGVDNPTLEVTPTTEAKSFPVLPATTSNKPGSAEQSNSSGSRFLQRLSSKTSLLSCFNRDINDEAEENAVQKTVVSASPTPSVDNSSPKKQIKFASLPVADHNTDSKRGLSPIVQSQLKNLRQRFRARTASFKKQAMEPVSPEGSDEEEETVKSPDKHAATAAPVDPHTFNNELMKAVASNTSKRFALSCCKPGKNTACTSTIAPQSHLYLSWLALVTMAYLYNIVSIVLRSTFTIYYTSDNYHIWLAIDYACDVLYLIDLIAVKPRIQFFQSGLLRTESKETRANYVRSSEFKLDILSLLPLDVFYSLTGIYGGAQSLLRLPRYLKLKTAWEFFDRFDQAAKSGHIIRVMRTLTYMLYLIHVETCGYYAISVYEGIGINQWVYNGEGIAYIRCFYLATKTATSIGNNPKPTNQLEYAFMTVYWLSGVFVFALLIGQIRDIFESANSTKTTYQKAQDSTLQYLQNLNVPDKVQNKVRDWFNYNWAQQKTLNENLLVDILPTKMKTDLFISVHYETLSKVSLFQDCDKTLLFDLILKLNPVIFLPGDFICRKGEVGTEMYIIMHGEVEVVTEEGQTLATLAKGKVFGEISLLGIAGGNRRTANVRSRGYSNLFVLSKADFERAMEDYPAAYALLKKRAQKLLKRTPNQTEKSKSSKDVSIISTDRPKTPALVTATIQIASKRGSKIAAWLNGHKRSLSRSSLSLNKDSDKKKGRKSTDQTESVVMVTSTPIEEVRTDGTVHSKMKQEDIVKDVCNTMVKQPIFHRPNNATTNKSSDVEEKTEEGIEELEIEKEVQLGKMKMQ